VRPRLGPLVKLTAALSGALLVFLPAGAASERSEAASAAKIVFVDVSQGDGVAMRIGGKIIVSDAGWPHKADEMHDRLTLLEANKHIDVAILSHPHLDHVGGFERLVEQFGYDIDTAIVSSNAEWLN